MDTTLQAVLIAVLATLVAVAASVWTWSATRPQPWTRRWFERYSRRVVAGGFAQTVMLLDPVSGKGVALPQLMIYSGVMFLLGSVATGLLLHSLRTARMRRQAAKESTDINDSSPSLSDLRRDSIGIAPHKASANGSNFG